MQIVDISIIGYISRSLIHVVKEQQDHIRYPLHHLNATLITTQGGPFDSEPQTILPNSAFAPRIHNTLAINVAFIDQRRSEKRDRKIAINQRDNKWSGATREDSFAGDIRGALTLNEAV